MVEGRRLHGQVGPWCGHNLNQTDQRKHSLGASPVSHVQFLPVSSPIFCVKAGERCHKEANSLGGMQ